MCQKRNSSVILIAATLIAASCTGVDFKDETRATPVMVRAQGEGLPSQYYFAAARTNKAQHWLGSVTPVGDPSPSTVNLSGGEFVTLLFGGDCGYSGITEFSSNASVPMSDICAVAPGRTPGGFDIDGFIPVLEPASLYRAARTVVLPYLDSDGQAVVLSFSPLKVEQKITIRIRLEEVGAHITSLDATLTGVPSKFEILGGHAVSEPATLGQIYKHCSRGNGYWEFSFSGWGIVPPHSEDPVSGPGILHLFIDDEVSGSVLHRYVNLLPILEEAPVMDGEGYLTVSSRTYDLSLTLDMSVPESMRSGELPIEDWSVPQDSVMDPIDDGKE